MSLILDGTNGLSDVDGTAATPAIRGTDTNTGIFFPAADTIAFAEGGAEVVRIDASGNLGVGTNNPTSRLHLSTSDAVVGKINSTSSGGPLLGLYKSGTTIGFLGVSGAWIGNTATDVALAAETGNGIGFFVNGSGSNTGGFSSSGNFSFNSGYGSPAVAYGCRAWVNFNGTGTVAIRASGNVTSVTDNGIGRYTVNLTNAMPDTNYGVMGAVGSSGSATGCWFTSGFSVNGHTTNNTTTSFRVQVYYQTGTDADTEFIYAAILR